MKNGNEIKGEHQRDKNPKTGAYFYTRSDTVNG